MAKQTNPAQHEQVVAEYTPATPADVQKAIDEALAAKIEWQNTPFEDRAAIFMRAANLVSGKYRYPLMAATMVGQGKNIWQAEIDAAAETCDLLRFNVQCAMDLFKVQPAVNPSGMVCYIHIICRSTVLLTSFDLVESPRVSASGRICLRNLSIQLHSARCDSGVWTFTDGQRRCLEALTFSVPQLLASLPDHARSWSS